MLFSLRTATALILRAECALALAFAVAAFVASNLCKADETAQTAATPASGRTPENSQVASPSDAAKSSNGPNNPNAQPPSHTTESPVVVAQPDGKVRMQFKDQSWLAALQWLASASAMNLDWQKLPDDKLNLVTQQSYSVDEARDLFNMQLLARGYTLLRHGEVLSVLPLENVNPTLFPRVQAAELDQRDAHEFARVTFPLQWLVAEKAVKEAAPMLSSFGKATPLEATNQIEVYDAVINLRAVRNLIASEESNLGRERLLEEFSLQHAKAEDVVQKLRELLGVSSRPRSRGPQVYEELRLDLEKTKVQAEAIQKLGQDAKQLITKESEVHFTINEEKNSILCHAAPDKMELVRQAIQKLDLPSDQPLRSLEGVRNVKMYNTPGADVDAVRDMLEQLKEQGLLSSTTWFDIEMERRLLIASATPEEHLAIASFIARYLPEDRSAEVMPLRRLEPQYAAEAVRLMIPPSNASASTANQLKIEVDEANRRLLVWGNEQEIADIRSFLAKLGEPQWGDDAPQALSVSVTAEDWPRVRSEFEARWKEQSSTPLKVEEVGTQTESPATRIDAGDSSAKGESVGGPAERTASAPPRFLRKAAFNQLPQADGLGEENVNRASTTQETTPELVLSPGLNGDIRIASRDGNVAARAEALLKEIAPPKPDYAVFPLKHALAYSVSYRLEEVLGIGEYAAASTAGPLASKKTAKIIADYQTNTLLVQNATDEQLERVRQLLELYDRPHPVDKDMARQQRVIIVRNVKAEQAAETLKEVYRDLLSSNDKAFDARQINSRDPGLRIGYAYSTRKEAQYQGQLSIGVDAKQNAVIVSAPGYLIKEVESLLEKLDGATGERSVVVRAVKGVDSDSLRMLLGGVTGKPIPSGSRWREGRRREER